jgi:hypothetical protein
MEEQRCLVEDCQGNVYSPAGTGYVCKEHFVNFLTWRRRKGAAMFTKYAGMTMQERDTITSDWKKTLAIEK